MILYSHFMSISLSINSSFPELKYIPVESLEGPRHRRGRLGPREPRIEIISIHGSLPRKANLLGEGGKEKVIRDRANI